MLAQIVLLLLFLLTAVAVTWRPGRLPEGWWPIVAGLVALVAGAIPLATAAQGLSSSLNVLAFFAGLLLLAWALRVNGSSGQLIDRMERWSGASGRKLLVAVAVATVVVTALLSNDAVALLLAPELLLRLQRRGLAMTPFVLTMAFTANAASALLPISNPVNLLVLDRSHISLVSYLGTVTPAAVVGVVITVLGCLLVTGRSLRQDHVFPAESLRERPAHRPASRWITGLIALLVLTDIGFAVARLPIGPPTLGAGALAALGVGLTTEPRRGPRGLGWSILALVAGFSVLASGLGNSPWLAATMDRLVVGTSWMTGVSTGLVTALISGMINNLPAALLVTAGLQAAHHLGTLTLPAIVGADLGPNLAPFGSLSTILILGVVRGQGEPVPWRRVFRLGVIVGPLALLPTLLLVALAR